MTEDRKEKIYEEILKRINEYKFVGYSDTIEFKEGNGWNIEVYSYPPYPEEELTDEDCYLGTIYIEDDGIHWEGEIINSIDELFKKIGLY